MTKLKLLLPILFLLIGMPLSAQEDAKAETERLMKLYQKLEGTYQIQIIDSREKIAFPLKTLETIEAKRHQTQTTYFWLKERVKIMVLPEVAINKKDFQPVERIIYTSSNPAKQ